MIRPRPMLLALLLALSLVAGACGDDDDDTATADDVTTDDAVSDSADDPAAGDDTESPTGSVVVDPEGSSADEVVSSGEGVCAEPDAVEALVAEFNSTDPDIPDRQYFEDLQIVVEQLQGADNGDLADALATLHVAMDDLGDIAEEADGNSDVADELLAGYDSETLGVAVLDFLEYASTECAIGDATDLEPFSDDATVDPASVLDDIVLGDPAEPIDTDDATFAALIESCFDGDGAACDELYLTTPIDSPEEAYGATCGGRTDDPVPGSCEQLLGAG